jgi:hypothetical protein
MSGVKPWWASKTLVGLIVAALATVMPDVDEALLGEIVNQTITLAGLAYAVYGRLTAKQELKLK